MSLLVVGAGVSGMAAARLARRVGTAVAVYDSDPAALTLADMEGFGTVGPEWSTDLAEGYETVVISPGIPPHSPLFVDTAGKAISEIEYGYRHTASPVVAVTGTNGKSTVTRAIAEIASANGIDAVACGNIGTALSDVADEPHDLLVVEVSSFQLYTIESFHPAVSVIVNVAPDHLDWHGSFDAYAAAKGRITENQTIEDLCVANAEDQTVRQLVAFTAATVELVAPSDPVTVGAATLVLPGWIDEAYRLDVALAVKAAARFGIEPGPTQSWLDRFEPGRHRREQIADIGGVVYVNDSKATNPHAAALAIRAYPRVVVVAGGRNKDLDLTPMMEAGPRHVVAIGEATGELEQLGHRMGVPTVAARDMADAVRKATALAEQGDTVLLAPGCTSFDMFEDYRSRGEAFAASVRALRSENTDRGAAAGSTDLPARRNESIDQEQF